LSPPETPLTFPPPSSPSPTAPWCSSLLILSAAHQPASQPVFQPGLSHPAPIFPTTPPPSSQKKIHTKGKCLLTAFWAQQESLHVCVCVCVFVFLLKMHRVGIQPLHSVSHTPPPSLPPLSCYTHNKEWGSNEGGGRTLGLRARIK
jgi:hypothetical protein